MFDCDFHYRIVLASIVVVYSVYTHCQTESYLDNNDIV